ncbi:penicillin-binding protein 1A [Immundisolibacter sp.]|uniref:penicillin-binding protein 1A n=1 Tax=Immundisolibacter sp. TaxID=1934948 RepID=UPI003F878E5F
MLKRLALAGVAGALSLAFAGALIAVALFLALDRQLPTVDHLRQAQLALPLQVYSADGLRIAEFGDQRRIPLDAGQLPQPLVQAILAAEDDRFFEHPGFDTKSLVRAAWQLARTGQLRQGGSTITMQVARNFFLTKDKTFLRKALEILLAVRIEQALTKEQILGLYVNKIFLGNRAYGFGAAAQMYYGRPVEQLTLPEMATLAGLPKAPSRDNPLANPQRALQRRNYVLGRMHALGYIDTPTYEAARQAPTTAGHNGFTPELDASYVAEMARAWMVERYGEQVYASGYRVITTLDGSQQRAANDALRRGLHAYDRRHGFRGALRRLSAQDLASPERLAAALDAIPPAGNLQAAVRLDDGSFRLAPNGHRLAPEAVDTSTFGRRWQASPGDVVYLAPTATGWQLAQAPAVEGALVALRPTSGAITALVGGYDFARSRFNRAVQAQRQPGSTFKPFIYATALASGYTAASIINDAPVAYPVDTPDGYWRPENYSGRFYGPTRLREALAQSRNLVSVRLLASIGVDFARRYCLRFGFPAERLPPNLSLALGTGSLTPLEMTAGYAVIANGGYRVAPYFISEVQDADGNTVWQAPQPVLCESDCDAVMDHPSQTPAPRVIPATDAYILASMLRDVIDHGTGVRARQLGRSDLAGKTGTTNEVRDAWFAGFQPSLLTTVWVGYDQPRSLGKNETGARAALPIWMDFMARALSDVPESRLPVPDGLVSLRIDRSTGQRTLETGPHTQFEWFSADRLPPMPQERATSDAAPTTGSEAGLF